MLTFPMVFPRGDYRVLSHESTQAQKMLYIYTSAIARKGEVGPIYAGSTALSVHPIQDRSWR